MQITVKNLRNVLIAAQLEILNHREEYSPETMKCAMDILGLIWNYRGEERIDIL